MGSRPLIVFVALLSVALLACGGRPQASVLGPESEPLQPGDAAPDFSLPTASGEVYSAGEIDSPTLLFFSMGPGCAGCMRQIVSLDRDEAFQKLGVDLVSIAVDRPDAWTAAASEAPISSTLLSDEGGSVSEAYGVMRWAMGNEPGHTFVLVEDGVVRWIRDYGAPGNGGRMYVPPDELLRDLAGWRDGGVGG